ncbi:MAG: DNA replication/repair protein RecF [Oscillospiraceae bacterium]|nr:DNA replication/repair protein RecF [Oscillospiraceae bacterium]MDD4413238.1 DNA replication/repair protein RecF [Oscillospiraceae bacterium]
MVERLEYEGFRNLETGGIQPVPEVNILYGQNGQGKTNLLEAIWFFTGGRSFRGARDSDTVQFGREKAKLKIEFFAQERKQQAEITVEKRRSASLGGILLPSASRLAGHFCAIVFSPAHLTLIKDGPEGRRRFLDAAYCQLRPGYMRVLAEYQRILMQRNALLKNIRNGERAEALEIWDEKLAGAGARVFAARTAYIRKITPAVKEIYSGISGGKEIIDIEYSSSAGDLTVSPEEARQKLISLFKQSVGTDIETGFTTSGPHRDDLVVDIEGKAARLFASQGQQRSAVLALKLAEASVLREVTGEQPVALLDDVMSELDTARQDYVLNHIHGWQVFLTCCDPSPVMRMNGGKVFRVDKGRITDMTSERGA